MRCTVRRDVHELASARQSRHYALLGASDVYLPKWCKPVSRFSEDRPRPHPYRFAHHALRAVVMNDPHRFIDAADRGDFDRFLTSLWTRVGEDLSIEERVPPDGISVTKHTSPSHEIVVVTLP